MAYNPATERFYVYVYVRPDTFAPFYVGKGTRGRALELARSRNVFFKNIVAKLAVADLHPVCCVVRDSVTEAEAFAHEIELIAQLRGQGFELANATNGGEGASGLKFSEDARKRISAALRGKKQSIETVEKRKASRAGYAHSEATKAKIGRANYAGGRKLKPPKPTPDRSGPARRRWADPEKRAALLAAQLAPDALAKRSVAIRAAFANTDAHARGWATRRKNAEAKIVQPRD